MSGEIFMTTANRPEENNNSTQLKLPKVKGFNKYSQPLKFQRTKYLLNLLTGNCQNMKFKIAVSTRSLKLIKSKVYRKLLTV